MHEKRTRGLADHEVKKMRLRGTETADWHSTRHSTQAQITRVIVALRKVSVGAIGRINSEKRKRALKRAWLTKSVTDCAANGCTEQPAASSRISTMQNPLC